MEPFNKITQGFIPLCHTVLDTREMKAVSGAARKDVVTPAPELLKGKNLEEDGHSRMSRNVSRRV